MKSFNQFQQDSFFLMEAAADKFAAMDDKQFADYVSKNPGGAEKAKKLRDQGLKAKTTRVSGENIRGTAARPSAGRGGGLVKTAAPSTTSASPTATTTAKTSASPVSGVKSSASKGKFSGLGRNLGRAGYALDAGLETMDQKARGRKTASAVTMGASKAAGGWAGAKLGAKTGAALGSVLGPKGAAVGAAVGGIGGYMAGSGIAGKASEVVAGSTGKEKAAMAQKNRQRQSGGGVAGIGGKTTFSKGKGGTAFMSTGVGKQRKTVQLDKTSVVRDAKGKEAVGHLAFKGGKAVYKRAADPSSLAKTSSNPFERVGRTLFAGAYKKHDAAKKQQAIAKARQSDVKRQQKLGVKLKPGG
jgi:hypothetical protein